MRTAISGCSATGRSRSGARGVVFPEPITEAISRITAVDLAVTYGVPAPGGTVAVTAITLRPGRTVTVADLTEAVAAMAVGLPPDVVHVVPDLPLSASYRPTVSALRAAGCPNRPVTAGIWTPIPESTSG